MTTKQQQHATETEYIEAVGGNGRNIQRDASGGQGHCWRDVGPDNLPSQVREEIESIDGDRDDYEASNGQHYRWTAAASEQQHATETKHTPGPWFTGDDDPCVCRMVENAHGESESQRIATVEVCGFEVGEPAANARLIAAAPELLEALRHIADLAGGNIGPKGVRDRMVKMGIAALAAIARAEGR